MDQPTERPCAVIGPVHPTPLTPMTHSAPLNQKRPEGARCCDPSTHCGRYEPYARASHLHAYPQYSPPVLRPDCRRIAPYYYRGEAHQAHQAQTHSYPSYPHHAYQSHQALQYRHPANVYNPPQPPYLTYQYPTDHHRVPCAQPAVQYYPCVRPQAQQPYVPQQHQTPVDYYKPYTLDAQLYEDGYSRAGAPQRYGDLASYGRTYSYAPPQPVSAYTADKSHEWDASLYRRQHVAYAPDRRVAYAAQTAPAAPYAFPAVAAQPPSTSLQQQIGREPDPFVVRQRPAAEEPPRIRPAEGDRPAMDLRRYLENWDEEYEDPKLPDGDAGPEPDVREIRATAVAPQTPVFSPPVVSHSQQVTPRTPAFVQSPQKPVFMRPQTASQPSVYLQSQTTAQTSIAYQSQRQSQTAALKPSVPQYQHGPIGPPSQTFPRKPVAPQSRSGVFQQTTVIRQPLPVASRSGAPQIYYGPSGNPPERYQTDFVDVESKISQSVIHKDVGCNFQIKPCSPGPDGGTRPSADRGPWTRLRSSSAGPGTLPTASPKRSDEAGRRSADRPSVRGPDARERGSASDLCRSVEVISYSESMTQYERKIDRETRVCDEGLGVFPTPSFPLERVSESFDGAFDPIDARSLKVSRNHLVGRNEAGVDSHSRIYESSPLSGDPHQRARKENLSCGPYAKRHDPVHLEQEKRMKETFPNMSVSNEDQIGVILNMGNSNQTVFGVAKENLHLPEYLESVIRQPTLDNLHITDSGIFNDVDRLQTTTVKYPPAEDEPRNGFEKEQMEPDDLRTFDGGRNVSNDLEKFTHTETEIDMDAIFNLEPSVPTVHNGTKMDSLCQLNEHTFDYSMKDACDGGMSEATRPENANQISKVVDTSSNEILEDFNDTIVQCSRTDLELPKLIDDTDCHGQKNDLQVKELDPDKSFVVKKKQRKMFFSKKLNRFEYSMENSGESFNSDSSDDSENEFPNLNYDNNEKIDRQNENNGVRSEVEMTNIEESKVEIGDNLKTDIAAVRIDAKEISNLPSLDHCTDFNNIMCDSEKLFEIDVNSPTDREVMLRHEDIFTDDIVDGSVSVKSEIDNTCDEVPSPENAEIKTDSESVVIDQGNHSMNECLETSLMSPKVYHGSDNESMEDDGYEKEDICHSKDVDQQYDEFLMEDSLSDDNYLGYKSVMLCGQQNSDSSAEEESELSCTRDRTENSNLDVNGLEIGGCWIDDIACVETVVSEENVQSTVLDCDDSQQSWRDYKPETPDDPDIFDVKSPEGLMKDSNCNVITDFMDKYDGDIKITLSRRNSKDYMFAKCQSDDGSLSPAEDYDDDDYEKSEHHDSEGLENDASYKKIYAELKSQFDEDDASKRSKSDKKKRKKLSEGDTDIYANKSKNQTKEACRQDTFQRLGRVKTKGAQKYIPPDEPSEKHLKVHLPLPKDKLLSLKRKNSKSKKHSSEDGSAERRSVNRMVIPKKPVKPKFEDVLLGIDKTIIQMKLEKTKNPKKLVPKMVIKKNEQGSHYASIRVKKPKKSDPAVDDWQPKVCLKRSASIDDMVKDN